jgi:hypothetical protein
VQSEAARALVYPIPHPKPFSNLKKTLKKRNPRPEKKKPHNKKKIIKTQTPNSKPET